MRKHEYYHGMYGDMHIPPPDYTRNDKLSASGITEGVGAWIVESLRLPSLGMPDGSFTLVLDSTQIRQATTAAFNVVQRDVA